jgi:hypothetical protein
MRVQQRTELFNDAFSNPDGGGARARIDVDAYGRIRVGAQRVTLNGSATTKAANAADTKITNDNPGPSKSISLRGPSCSQMPSW